MDYHGWGSGSMMRLILNGKVGGDPRLREAVHHLRDAGTEVEVRATWEVGQAAYFAEEAARAGVDLVVAGGGDGTLHEVIDGVHRSGAAERCAVGVLPLGTANDFATACRLTGGEPLETLQAMLHHEPQWIDVGKLGEQTFINVASCGLAAEVTARTSTESKGLLGSIAYLLTGIRYASTVQPWHARLRAINYEYHGPVYAVFVGNNRFAGGGFPVCPRAVLNDGLLDVTVIPDMPFEQVLELLGEVLTAGTLLDHPQVQSLQVPWFKVDVPVALHVNLDGEPMLERHFHFEVVPSAVRMHLSEYSPLQGVREPG